MRGPTAEHRFTVGADSALFETMFADGVYRRLHQRDIECECGQLVVASAANGEQTRQLADDWIARGCPNDPSNTRSSAPGWMSVYFEIAKSP